MKKNNLFTSNIFCVFILSDITISRNQGIINSVG
ncbi:hypothetical protein EPYR_00425 [Erwinia pyrifoliae DSM 12163]|nr:hypothetical protein EPYR_00425 [Erwinia pyrifoliae DSM 12163]